MTTQSQTIARGSQIRKIMARISNGPTQVRMPYQAPDGSYPIVIAFPNEYMSQVFGRVKAYGGTANLVYADTKSFRVLMIEGGDGAEEGDADTTINRELSLGMFMIKYGRQTGTKTFRFGNVSVSTPSDSAAVAYA